MIKQLTDFDQAVDHLYNHLHPTAKMNLKQTEREDLICWLLKLGQRVRILYDMWNNPKLLQSCGCDHPDAASLTIIAGVWERIRKEPEPELDGPLLEPPIDFNSCRKAVEHYETVMGKKLCV